MKKQEIIFKRFKDKGFKLTPQRLAILDSLQGDTSHPGANEIFNRLKGSYPSLSMTTVYNTLDMLNKIGEVIELTVERNRIRYDPNTSIHDHILCVNCKVIIDVPALNKNVIKKTIKGFKVLGVSNQYYGLCKKCQ